jgi:hypothetical protein
MKKAKQIINIIEGFKLGSLGADKPKFVSTEDPKRYETELEREFRAKEAEINEKIKDLKIKHYQWFIDILKKTKHKIPDDIVEALRTDPKLLFRDLSSKYMDMCYAIYAKYESKADKFSDKYQEAWVNFSDVSERTDWQFNHNISPLMIERRDLLSKFHHDLAALKNKE